jgi:hypothetical protein
MIEKVKIPETVADMPISKAKFFVELTELAGENVEPDFLAKLDAVQVSDLNAVFFESAPDHFDRYTDYSNRVILANILESASKYTENKPRAEIVDNGTKYVLNLDFTDQPVSFHRDIKSIDPRTGMVDIIGMMYIEDGLVYNEIDKSNKIKNPRRERGEILEKHFNLAQYLDLKAFFLQSWKGLMPYSSERQRELVQRKKNGIGKNQSIM